MKYVVINNACDGRHVSTHATFELAQNKMTKMIGPRPESFELNRTYISDWGNALTIEKRTDNWTSSLEHQMADAFDARECGTATVAQLKLLEDKGF